MKTEMARDLHVSAWGKSVAQGSDTSLEEMFASMNGRAAAVPRYRGLGLYPLDIADPNDPRNQDPSNPGSQHGPVGGPFHKHHSGDPFAPDPSTVWHPGPQAPWIMFPGAARVGKDILRSSRFGYTRGDINDYLRAAIQGKLQYAPEGGFLAPWDKRGPAWRPEETSPLGLDPTEERRIDQELMGLRARREGQIARRQARKSTKVK